MELFAVGVNHTTAPIVVREKLALLPEDLPKALAALAKHVPEAAILSTCNRTELYGNGPDAKKGLVAFERFLVESRHLHATEVGPYLNRYTQEEATSHLFAVASGIDSMVLGETEILGQVSDALVAASKEGRMGTPLLRLFHHALRTGRRARSETGISRHALSVSYAAVQMAKQVFDGLSRSRVLVISAGEAGKLTAKTLKDAGVAQIGVANRTRSKAETLAEELGGETVEFEGIPEALVEYDIVISATASTRFVIEASSVAQAMKRRGGRALCLIDIAVPRDIDPESRRIAGVHLYNIDDLEAITATNRAHREKEKAKVEAIIGEEVERFSTWYQEREAVPVIAALREKAENIRVRELGKSLKKLEHLSAEDRQRIDDLTAALTRKLLHDPIVTLKDQSDSPEFAEAIRDLFQLGKG